MSNSVVEKNKVMLDMLESNFELGFNMLFMEFHKPMTRVASRIIDERFVEDIVQDIFLSLWNSKLTFNNIISLKSYLFSAVNNKCLKEIRKNKVHQKYQVNFDAQVFHHILMDEEIYSLLMSAIEKLPINYKDVINLTLDGESIASIAKKMQTTEDSVKAYKRRAKKMLKLSLDKFSYLILFTT